MAKNIKLKNALLARDISQRELARRSGIHETTLSSIINGWLSPKESQQQKIASAIGYRREDIFAGNSATEN